MRLLIGWLLLGLASVSPANAAEGLSARELVAARKVYVAKCAKCHRFYEATNYAEPEWRTWMDKMGKKAKLKPAQADLLNRYLDTYRAGRLPGKPEAKP